MLFRSTGKGNKKLLRDGFTPAVIYNAKGESINIQVPTDIALKIVKDATSTTIIEIEIDGKNRKALVKDLDVNSFTNQIRHISFFEIDENEDMIFSIPFVFEGISPAVKNNLGILVKVLSAVEVKGKLADLVDNITIDISTLEHPGQTIGLDDIELPKGMHLVNADLAKSAIATITIAQKQEEEEISADTAEGATEKATEEVAEE